MLHLKHALQTQRRRFLHISKTHDQHLEAFPPARQGTILNSHRVIGIATNTSMVQNCALGTYVKMTADVGLLWTLSSMFTSFLKYGLHLKLSK